MENNEVHLVEISNAIFCGRYLPGMMHTATKNFFKISRRIKQKLGNKSYKLDEYLELILKIVNIRLTADAAEDGRKYFSQLMSL